MTLRSAGTLRSMTQTLKTADRALGTADQFLAQLNSDVTPEARATLIKARETLGSVLEVTRANRYTALICLLSALIAGCGSSPKSRF